MMKDIYVIRDDVSGAFGEPFVAANINVVGRALSDPKLTPPDNLRDISVLCLGAYDDLGKVPLIHADPAPHVALTGLAIYNMWQARYEELKLKVPVRDVALKEDSLDDE